MMPPALRCCERSDELEHQAHARRAGIAAYDSLGAHASQVGSQKGRAVSAGAICHHVRLPPLDVRATRTSIIGFSDGWQQGRYNI